MSGFSPTWLALREPADRKARNPDLLGALANRFAGRDSLSIADLGCGTGSNLRALAGVLPARQHWHLVDHDPTLLQAAREKIGSWADPDEPQTNGADLALRRGGREITVSFHQADLASGLEAALPEVDLVTAAALFDLVSRDWIERFAQGVAARGAVFYTALTYDGLERWQPPHPGDGPVHGAFLAHQGGDKGFGPSAGPGATEALVEAFRARGYRVRTAESPWRLGAEDAPLIQELARGIAGAARETGRVPEGDLRAWLDARLSGATCTIGHADCLAFPA